MGPIITGSGDVVDKIFMLKYLPYFAFEELVSNTLLHIYNNCPCLELVYLRADWEGGIFIYVGKERAEGVIIEPRFIIFGVLVEEEFPKLVADLVAALANLDSDEFSWHLFKR